MFSILSKIVRDASRAVAANIVARSTCDRRLAWTLAAFFWLLPGWTLAEDALAQRLEQLMDGERYARAHWGVLVVDLESGEKLYERDAEKLFAPASVTKLFSVAAALDALGADYRFETKVYRRGEIDERGVLRGDLILRASGDLTLGGRTDANGEIEYTNSDHTYANGNDDTVLTKADPLAGLNELAGQLVEGGIKHVQGDVLVDERFFDIAESSGSGPNRVGPLLVNDNCVDVVFEPTKAGEPAKITTRPETKLLAIESHVETVAADGKLETWLRSPGAGKLIITGKIPEGHKPVVRIHEIDNAARFARALFLEALERAGVKTDAALDSPGPKLGLPAAEEYDALTVAANNRSPPFAENAQLILKVSHNLHASTLPLLVAAKHGERTLSQGLRREKAFFERAGLAADSVSFAGGAGGARADHVTPAATVALLRYMSTREDFEAYERALPILGIDGTLSKAVGASSNARGRVQAKTGTLFWTNGLDGSALLTSKALAGYATTKKDRRVAFAMFVNGVPLRGGLTTNSIGADLGRLCEIVVEER